MFANSSPVGNTRARFLRQFVGLDISQDASHLTLSTVDRDGTPITWHFATAPMDQLIDRDGLKLIAAVYERLQQLGVVFSYGKSTPTQH